MNNSKLFNGLLRLLMVELIFFSISNFIIVIADAYESFLGKNQPNPVSFLNLKVILIPIWVLATIVYLYYKLCKIKKIQLEIIKINIKILLLIGIPFILSGVIVILDSIYLAGFASVNYNAVVINRYTIVLLLIFIIISIVLICTLIKILMNRALFISKTGSKLIFIIGITFIASMMLLNTMSKFIESYLLDYSNIKPKVFVRTYNTISLGFIIVVMVAFILIILSAVNKWVEYLNYMALKLKKISEIQYIDDLDINGSDEFSELANSINIMSRRLKDNYEREKKIEKGKNDLIVSVSHDLKTPLTAIIGYLELLKNEKIEDHEKRIEYINIAYEKSLVQKKLIDELFEYTKVVNDYVFLEKIQYNIAILINQILGEQAIFFKEKDIAIKFESEPNEIYCEIDVEKMVRIIENIVRNAQKYSFPNTMFRVYIRDAGNEILMSFENTGEHIKKEELDLIFEKMYRLDKSRSSENEGSGLGLAIAKRLVELHNGKLWAECEGTTIKFTMTIPKYS